MLSDNRKGSYFRFSLHEVACKTNKNGKLSPGTKYKWKRMIPCPLAMFSDPLSESVLKKRVRLGSFYRRMNMYPWMPLIRTCQ